MLATITSRIVATLHVERTAVLVPAGHSFCIATTAIPGGVPVCLASNARGVEQIRNSRKPVVVYLDDEDSWVNQIGGEERGRLRALNAEALLVMSNLHASLRGRCWHSWRIAGADAECESDDFRGFEVEPVRGVFLWGVLSGDTAAGVCAAGGDGGGGGVIEVRGV